MQTQLLQICGKHVIKQVENKFSEGKRRKNLAPTFLGATFVISKFVRTTLVNAKFLRTSF
jgi:hypothetical protein